MHTDKSLYCSTVSLVSSVVTSKTASVWEQLFCLGVYTPNSCWIEEKAYVFIQINVEIKPGIRWNASTEFNWEFLSIHLNPNHRLFSVA